MIAFVVKSSSEVSIVSAKITIQVRGGVWVLRLQQKPIKFAWYLCQPMLTSFTLSFVFAGIKQPQEMKKKKKKKKKNAFEACHEIMVIFVFHKFIVQTRMRSHPVGKDVRSLRLLPYFMCANSVAKALARAFACHLCDKYHNLMSRLKVLRIEITIFNVREARRASCLHEFT